jgi:hypothetical protein
LYEETVAGWQRCVEEQAQHRAAEHHGIGNAARTQIVPDSQCQQGTQDDQGQQGHGSPYAKETDESSV